MPKDGRVGADTCKHTARKDKIVFDTLNLNIIKEILNDADVRSTDIATKYRMPLSTIQRRRTRLERSVLKKIYPVNIKELGWRNAGVLVAVEKGDSEKIAELLLE